MKKIVLMCVLLLCTPLVFAGTPDMNVDKVEYKNRLHQVIDYPYYSGDSINVYLTVSDSSGWTDIKKVFIEVGEYRLDCYRNRKIPTTTTSANYECHFSIFRELAGQKDFVIHAVDKGGLTDDVLIGNYYFNPKPVLYHTSLAIVDPLIPNQTAYSDNIDVSVDTPTNNPYKIYLQVKNLAPTLNSRGTCPIANVLSYKMFEYKNGDTWLSPTGKKDLIFEGRGSLTFDLQLRVNVPAICNGDFVADGRNTILSLTT